MDKIIISKTIEGLEIPLYMSMLNRHGLISGATGTGKTVTLKVIVEQLSKAGIPTFAPDIKGDLSGLAKPNSDINKDFFKERISKLNITDYHPSSFPVEFFDFYGQSGHGLRTTLTEMGPILLAKIFELNDTQEGILHILFKIADENGLLLIDLKDLEDLNDWVNENTSTLEKNYGKLSPQSLLAIKRKIIVLRENGGDSLFGEPAIKLSDFIKVENLKGDNLGQGIINILDATKAINSPRIYAAFLLWLLSELFESLPEVGDLEKPKFVIFFDEAHYLFDEASSTLLQKIETVVRLIRSKGVGIYFITQNVTDIPDSILQQLGNKIQHGVRAFTAKDQKNIKATANSFRTNANIDIASTILTLQVGEALVSFLDEKGVPSVVEHVLICPPSSSFGAISDQERKNIISSSPLYDYYKNSFDRESASEMLKKRKDLHPEVVTETITATSETGILGKYGAQIGKSIFRQLVSKLTTTVTREIIRGVMGSIKGK